MASPQPDQHTRISNELLEAKARMKISGSENQIWDVILRLTYGYHKKVAEISLKTFSELTGLYRNNCKRAVDKLIERNMVLKIEYPRPVRYGIQKDYEKWVGYSKLSTGYSKLSAKGTQKRVPKVLKNECKAPYEAAQVNGSQGPKENFKERKKHTLSVKKPTDPNVKIFIDYYHEIFFITFKEKPNIQGGKDGQIVKRLIKKYGIEKLKFILKQFFDSEDDFIRNSGYTLGAFSSQINKLIAKPKPIDKFRHIPKV